MMNVSGCFAKEFELLWVTSWVTQVVAMNHCESLGLSLFDLINGDVEIGLMKKYPAYINPNIYIRIWVGVVRTGGVWKTLSGKNVGRYIIWDNTQPSNDDAEDFVLFNVQAYLQRGRYAYDAVYTEGGFFFCY